MGTGDRVLGIGHWGLGIGYWVLGIRYWALGNTVEKIFLVPSPQSPVPSP
ncbi:hypothetical protein [Nostoc sp. CMAA1605]|nr:hypothetical protein [Nostoc sp. CMAA1605]